MIKLDVVVVGGGIGGLATALSLQLAGHKVTVLERHETPRSSNAGIKSPPNMTRVLDAWGLESLVKARGVPCDRLVWHTGETGEVLGIVPFYAEFIAELTAGFYMMSHSDLHSALLDLALSKGVTIRYSVRVEKLDTATATVFLEGGETITGDLIVAADGATSTIRDTIIGESEDYTEGQDYVDVGLSIPVDSLGDVVIPTFKSDTEWGMWFGDSYFIGVHYLDGKESVTVHMSEPTTKSKVDLTGEDWIEHSFNDFKLEHEMTFEPRLQKLLTKAKSYTRMIHKRRPPLESFTDEFGKCVLVGDAAHSLSPFSTQSTALSIEDAAALGVLLSRIHSKEQLPHFLSAYEEIRIPRAHQCQVWDAEKRDILTLPKGEMQEQRDARWRSSVGRSEAAWDALDHEEFLKDWGGEMSQYIYHAEEAAEDWWTKWGAVLLRDFEDSKGEPFKSPTQVRVERVQRQQDGL